MLLLLQQQQQLLQQQRDSDSAFLGLAAAAICGGHGGPSGPLGAPGGSHDGAAPPLKGIEKAFLLLLLLAPAADSTAVPPAAAAAAELPGPQREALSRQLLRLLHQQQQQQPQQQQQQLQTPLAEGAPGDIGGPLMVRGPLDFGFSSQLRLALREGEPTPNQRGPFGGLTGGPCGRGPFLGSCSFGGLPFGAHGGPPADGSLFGTLHWGPSRPRRGPLGAQETPVPTTKGAPSAPVAIQAAAAAGASSSSNSNSSSSNTSSWLCGDAISGLIGGAGQGPFGSLPGGPLGAPGGPLGASPDDSICATFRAALSSREAAAAAADETRLAGYGPWGAPSGRALGGPPSSSALALGVRLAAGAPAAGEGREPRLRQFLELALRGEVGAPFGVPQAGHPQQLGSPSHQFPAEEAPKNVGGILLSRLPDEALLHPHRGPLGATPWASGSEGAAAGAWGAPLGGPLPAGAWIAATRPYRSAEAALALLPLHASTTPTAAAAAARSIAEAAVGGTLTALSQR